MPRKPARRPVSAAEWQRRWQKLRLFVVAHGLGCGLVSRSDILAEMSRLTRPTPRRPKVKR